MVNGDIFMVNGDIFMVLSTGKRDVDRLLAQTGVLITAFKLFSH